MSYATTYGLFQSEMKKYYLRTGRRMQFPEMIQSMVARKLISRTDPSRVYEIKQDLDGLEVNGMSDEAFNRIIDKLILVVPEDMAVGTKVAEQAIIPNQRDVYVIRHPRYTRPLIHMHNYFEIDYVASGSCTFVFEDTERVLQEGECCIIAPYSRHDLVIADDSTVFCIMIRKSTFNTTFFSLRSGSDLLSYFFRSILQNDHQANYLLFISKRNNDLKNLMRRAMLESYRNDDLSNACCISLMNLIFANLLRNYSKTLQYYDYSMGSDFSLVLQYIQHNYQTLTLSSLAEIFHYSEPHLCTMIRENTGHSFTQLIRELRMQDAVDCLINTNMKVSEIAEQVGYNSADHFSRVFRNVYHVSPLEYRRTHKSSQEKFNPFRNITEDGTFANMS